MLTPITVVELHRFNPTRNMRRFYRLAVERERHLRDRHQRHNGDAAGAARVHAARAALAAHAAPRMPAGHLAELSRMSGRDDLAKLWWRGVAYWRSTG